MDNSPTLAIVAGLMHAPMAVVVWTTLVRHWPRRQLSLWIGGALTIGTCSTLFALHGRAPVWATDVLANALLAPGFALRIAALRLDLKLPVRGATLALLSLGQIGAYALVRQASQALALDPFIAMLWPHVLGAAWAFAFAWHSWQVARKFGSRSGWLLAVAEFAFGLALLTRALAMSLGWIERSMFSNDWATHALEVTGFLATLYSNLGYLGMVLDRSRAAERQSRDEQLSEQLRREAAEQRSTELHQLLSERNRVLHMLAHEIRQPLHNASGALQAAARSLHLATGSASGAADAAPRADQALQRAQGVLRRVQSVLDNTLAAAQLFAADAAPATADTDLDLLVHLTLGDLAADARARVQLDWQTSIRSIELEPGLVRLALRNVLNNAFEHGGSAVQVKLVVAEQAAPPALLLRVVDDGPVVSAELLHRLQPAPSQPDLGAAAAPASDPQATHPQGEGTDTFGRGLGLALARRVLQLHGGELRITAAPTHGLEACLVFYLPAE